MTIESIEHKNFGDFVTHQEFNDIVAALQNGVTGLNNFGDGVASGSGNDYRPLSTFSAVWKGNDTLPAYSILSLQKNTSDSSPVPPVQVFNNPLFITLLDWSYSEIFITNGDTEIPVDGTFDATVIAYDPVLLRVDPLHPPRAGRDCGVLRSDPIDLAGVVSLKGSGLLCLSEKSEDDLAWFVQKAPRSSILVRARATIDPQDTSTATDVDIVALPKLGTAGQTNDLFTDLYGRKSVVSYGKVFALRGETFWVTLPDESGTGSASLDQSLPLVPSETYGLLRRAKVLDKDAKTCDIHNSANTCGDFVSSGVTITYCPLPGASINNGDEIYIQYITGENQWYLISSGKSSSFELFQAELNVDSLKPGETQQFLLYEYNETTCAYAPGAVTVDGRDIGSQNFLLKGERVWLYMKRQTCTGQGRDEYYILGSHGLRRRAVPSSDIECGQDGTVTVASQTATCSGNEVSTTTLTACNGWGATRPIKASEEVFIWYDQNGATAGRWFIDPTDEPIHAQAVLEAKMCSSDPSTAITASITYFDRYKKDCSGFITGAATLFNPYGLAAPAGSKVELRRDIFNDIWEIVQVQHTDTSNIASLFYDSATNSVKAIRETVTVMQCDPATSETTELTLIENQIVTDIRLNRPDAFSCNVDANVQTIIAFEDMSVLPDNWVTKYSHTVERVITDVSENIGEESPGLYKDSLLVYVPCKDLPGDRDLVVDYFDCETAGSQNNFNTGAAN
jgi:hypothetical protein